MYGESCARKIANDADFLAYRASYLETFCFWRDVSARDLMIEGFQGRAEFTQGGERQTRS